MNVRLFLVHGSHPCAAIEKALAIKQLPYKVVEIPAGFQPPVMRVLFGARTVPAIRIDAEKVSGSRAIMHRLDELVPAPALYPADPAARARVEEADRWGDEVFQPIARELVWPGIARRPDAAVSYGEHARIRMPAAVARAGAPLVARVEIRLNRTSDALAAQRMRELPGNLDRIDAWISDGTIGDPQLPNAADLQILSTIRLMQTFADVRPLLDDRPLADAALALFPHCDGELPAGAIPGAEVRPES
jgi:glutathione S-transferase